MNSSTELQGAPFCQQRQASSNFNSEYNNGAAGESQSPETVNVDLTASERSSSREQLSESNSPAPFTPAVHAPSPLSDVAQAPKCAGDQAAAAATTTSPFLHLSPPLSVLPLPEAVPAAPLNASGAEAVPVDCPYPTASGSRRGTPSRDEPISPTAFQRVETAPPAAGDTSGAALTSSQVALASVENSVPTPTATIAQKEPAGKSMPSAPTSASGKAATPSLKVKASRTPARRAASQFATPSKQKTKRAAVTPAQINELLSGTIGRPSKSASPEKTHMSNALPPLDSLDLPLGLLLLYCVAEDSCTVMESVAAGSPADATTTASSSSAYSLLYMLEQLSDMRRRDRRKAAIQNASATEEAKCKELFEAAAKRHSANAAQEAARARDVAEEELGKCTFHPNVSPTAQRIAGKGTKDFMAKCLEWREEAERRLREKYARQAELEAEQAAASAAQNGVVGPGEAVTLNSRRLLEQPSVQERLKARPSLWESKRPASGAVLHDVRGGVAPASTATAGSSAYVLGIPIGSKLEEEQEAVLRTLRRRDGSGEDSSILHTSALHHAGKGKGKDTVQQFLSRVEEDAERREATAARLVSRYHNPEMERYEAGTGQPLFVPNSMPTVWKDGRRVGYEDLSKDEQRDFCAELRKAGLGFVLTRYYRDAQDQSVDHEREEKADVNTDDALAQTQGTALTAGQQERFLASLKEALAKREKNLERLREQATKEETFHPHISSRTTNLARHKIGNKPIYERSTIARDAAAVPSKSLLNATTQSAPRTALNTSCRDRPLPEAAEVFLARNEQWTIAQQRRLERLAEMEEERRYSGCTFTPNRTIYDPEYADLHASQEAERSSRAISFRDASDEGSDKGKRKATQTRFHDEMATAADVRLMNELELLRSGAAFRNEKFVQAVCDRTGVADKRQAMANLSLQSAPRLSSSRAGLSSPVRYSNASASVYSSSQRISPIAKRSNHPSASPCAAPFRLGSRAEESPHSTYESQHSIPMMRTESGATQTPTRHRSHIDDIQSLRRPSASQANPRETAAALPPIEDPWAALDAQTDAILKRHGY